VREDFSRRISRLAWPVRTELWLPSTAGGAPRREHMYTREWLENTFSGWEILVLEDYDAVIKEGQAHNGMSALIDLVARKS
jgi:hypothetical protein